MRVPQSRTAAGTAGIRALLQHPQDTVIGLDFDGTLSPIVARPEEARALPEVVPALVRLAKHVGVVAVITGRPAAQAVQMGSFAGVPGLESLVILGQYGRERWDAGSGAVSAPSVPDGVAAVRRDLPSLLTDAPEGVHVEDKGAALVVHTRNTVDPAGVIDGLRAAITALAERNGLAVEDARLALELRPPGFDKGSALRQIVEAHGARAVVFVGDDLGDLPAFGTVEALRDEGVPGLTVASASDEAPLLAERADIVVDGPHGVVEFLRSLTFILESE